MSLFDKGLFAATAASALTVLYLVGTIIYSLFLHPLHKFPGPLLMRATRLPYAYKVIAGTLPFDMLDLHNRYGDVVRVAPNELAFLDEKTWQDIMPRFFYNPTNGPTNIISLVGTEHALLRRQLSPGFSERSLRSQQPIIMGYIDKLISRLHEHCKSGNVDLMSWYNFTTFDIIGDLAFGESFGCLENSDYHPWVRNIFAVVKVASVVQLSTHFPWLRVLIINVLSSPLSRNRQSSHRKLTREKLLRRIELGKNQERPDLIEGLLKKKDEWNMPSGHLERNASVLIVAGSESTATALSGITYLLTKNPEALRQLTEEIRSSFKSEEEIDFVSVNKLTYLLACLDEGLRMYPPVPSGLPRVSPEEGATVSGQYVPKNSIVAIHQWATYHSERNFNKPFEFHPERFLGDPEFESDYCKALQPFHTGPRGCLGRK
ncbi:cytochrome P450 [Ilyonectria sp. MPI-CAGE-AT-0026]|nr:cytochrome P450 [Ilyonectria sp. MPI-CAGE-AT-0026]